MVLALAVKHLKARPTRVRTFASFGILGTVGKQSAKSPPPSQETASAKADEYVYDEVPVYTPEGSVDNSHTVLLKHAKMAEKPEIVTEFQVYTPAGELDRTHTVRLPTRQNPERAKLTAADVPTRPSSHQ